MELPPSRRLLFDGSQRDGICHTAIQSSNVKFPSCLPPGDGNHRLNDGPEGPTSAPSKRRCAVEPDKLLSATMAAIVVASRRSATTVSVYRIKRHAANQAQAPGAHKLTLKASWRNGSALDFGSKGCRFESCRGRIFSGLLIVVRMPSLFFFFSFPFIITQKSGFTSTGSRKPAKPGRDKRGCSRRGSNPRFPAHKTSALTNLATRALAPKILGHFPAQAAAPALHV